MVSHSHLVDCSTSCILHSIMIRRTFIHGVVITTATALVTVGILAPKLGLSQSALFVFGSLYIFFLPGFVWSFMIWNFHSITKLERVMLSFFLSLAGVPIALYLANRLDLPFRTATTLGITSLIIGLGCVVQFKKFRSALTAMSDTGS